MRHLKLKLAYDGTNYVGWQVQNNGVSIQECLERGWHSVTQEAIRITASGRTDSGVHAKAQICSLKTRSNLPHQRLVQALNAETPEDISVLEIVDAPPGFHAIRDATSKTYVYEIQHGRIRNVIGGNYRWFVSKPMDVEAMRTASKYLLGEHDFVSFQTTGSERLTTTRNVTQLDLDSYMIDQFSHLRITISANGFLYNMVRSIVGTLVKVGTEKRPPAWVKEVLDAKDRRAAGKTAPAAGLTLDRVEYDF